MAPQTARGDTWFCFRKETSEGRGKEGLEMEGRGDQSPEQVREGWVLLGHDKSSGSRATRGCPWMGNMEIRVLCVSVKYVFPLTL